jgi:hypothetical protein
MEMTNRFKYWGRRIRSILFPIHDVGEHLGRLTKNSSKELGFLPGSIEDCVNITHESCLDLDFVRSHQKHQSEEKT